MRKPAIGLLPRDRAGSPGQRVAGLLVCVLAVLAIAYPAVAGAVPLERNARAICDIDWKASTQHRIRLIRCAVRFWPVPGGWRRAVAIARCESFHELRPRARTGVHVGVFQLSGRYYAEWYRTFGKALGLPRARTNARTNIIVAVRMANAWGWSAWSCA